MNEGANKNKQLPNIPVIFMQAVAETTRRVLFCPPYTATQKHPKYSYCERGLRTACSHD
jgi:hypothetical protein